MKKIIILITLSFLHLFSNVVEATTYFEECDSCSSRVMKRVAKGLLDNGEVVVYDSENEVAIKYRVSTDVEPGLVLKSAFSISMTEDEYNFTNLIYNLKRELGGASSSGVPVNIDFRNFGGVPVSEFDNLTAYDMFTTSLHRNQVADFIRGQISGITNNHAAATNALALILDAIEKNFKINVSLSVVVIFKDGSQAVFEVRADNGGVPVLDKSHPLNRDSEGQDILYENSVSGAGIYSFSSGASAGNFSTAASILGVTLLGWNSGNGAGTMTCVLQGNTLTCTYKEK